MCTQSEVAAGLRQGFVGAQIAAGPDIHADAREYAVVGRRMPHILPLE
jgi:hypothetical protein